MSQDLVDINNIHLRNLSMYNNIVDLIIQTKIMHQDIVNSCNKRQDLFSEEYIEDIDMTNEHIKDLEIYITEDLQKYGKIYKRINSDIIPS